MATILDTTLITGADGMVGSYVDFGIKTDHKELDVTDLDQVMRVVKKRKPEAIIHLAAMTDVDACEREPQRAYLVNSIGTYHLALAAKSVGAKLVYISTAGVFDGEKKAPYSEKDAPHPQNVYGHSKYLGEIAVRQLLDNYIIARASWMFGGGQSRDKKFVAKIIGQLDQPAVKAVNDKFGSPTFGKDIVAAVARLIVQNKKGLFHLSNTGRASRFDIAVEIVKFFDAKTKLVSVKGSFFDLPAKRVTNEAMSSQVSLMRPWREALREYLAMEWS